MRHDKGRDGLPLPVVKAGSSSRSRSSSPGLFSRVVGQPTLKISLHEELLFLHPTPTGAPAEDPILQGTVTLYLPKRRVLEELTVHLLGRQSILIGDKHESSDSLSKEVSLCAENVALEKGEHQFAFSIIVPSSTPCWEKCTYGRVKHTVQARAKGLGQLGGDVESVPHKLALIVNPGGAGASEPPPGMNERYEGTLPDVGPYAMSLQSNHLMVGGLLLIRLSFPSPPTGLLVHSIKVKVIQHFAITSPSNPSLTSTPPAETRSVIHLDAHYLPNFGDVRLHDRNPSGPLRTLKAGEGWVMHHLGRMPSHESLRPSTSQWSSSAIRVRHEISMEVIFQAVEGGGAVVEGPKKLVIVRPLQLSSCCCFVDSLMLPSYSVDQPDVDTSPSCLCGYSIEECIQTWHGKGLHGPESHVDDAAAGEGRRTLVDAGMEVRKVDRTPVPSVRGV